MKKAMILFLAFAMLAMSALAVDECPTSYNFGGPSGSDFGRSVAGIGDIGNDTSSVPDGCEDYIVGAPDDYDGNGASYVYSGADGALIRVVYGSYNSAHHGYSVSSAGFFNEDSVPDYVVGVYNGGVNRYGRVIVYSGADGTQLMDYSAPSEQDCGWSVSMLPDYDDDGFDEILVGAPTYSTGGLTACGRIMVFEGAENPTGTIQGSITGTGNNQKFGWAVAGLGDVDNDIDGISDFAVASKTGTIKIYSGSEWSTLLLTAPYTDVISAVGDVNEDGHADLLAGYPVDGKAFVWSGAAVSYTGQQCDQVYELSVADDAWFGNNVARGGLITDDNVPDIMVFDPGWAIGWPVKKAKVHVFSGVDGSLAFTQQDGVFNGTTFGDGMAGDVDTDGDGLSNLLIAQPDYDRLYVYSCTDADEDDVFDLDDNCPDVANTDQADGDNDDVGDVCDNCPTYANSDQANPDDDIYGSVCDNCPDVVNNDQADGDSDDVGNVCDNCPAIGNNDQANSDADSFGNVCDNCPDITNEDQADADADKFGDVCDVCPNDAWQCCPNGWPDRVAGDLDASGEVDITDLVYLVGFQFNGGPEPIPFLLAGDLTADKNVDISDLVYLVTYMFNGGPAPLNSCSKKTGKYEYTTASLGKLTLAGTIAADFDGDVTVLEIAIPDAVRGLQIDLVREDGADFSSLVSGIEVFASESAEHRTIGFLDIDGAEIIEKGFTQIMTISGEVEILSAIAATMDGGIVVLSIDQLSKPTELPDGYQLSQNHPNPFNPVTEIIFSLPHSTHANLEIFNISGQRVATLVDSDMPAGEHHVVWNASTVASGVYFYKLEADGFSATKKMLLLK